MTVFALLETALLIYFTLAVAYVVFFSFMGRFFPKKWQFPPADTHHKIAVMVPAYKEDGVIVPVAEKLLAMDYPSDKFDVVVIADSLQPQTLQRLRSLPIKVVEVDFEVSTKAKSLNFAFNQLPSNTYDIAVISDADNIMDARFLQQVNAAFSAGHYAIQGRRVAKNLNTPFASLDALSESINNHIFRKGFNAAGLSSALIGSGMAFHYPLLKDLLAANRAVGGFDKQLQLMLIDRGHSIVYLEDAIVYDEKVAHAQGFQNQRRRWLSSQYVFLKRYFIKGMKALFTGNISYFNLSILASAFLSRVLTLTCLGVLALASVALMWVGVPTAAGYWWALLLAYGTALLLGIHPKLFQKKVLLSVLQLPQAIWLMVLAMLKLKGADKKFIHTAHSVAEVDNSVLHETH